MNKTIDRRTLCDLRSLAERFCSEKEFCCREAKAFERLLEQIPTKYYSKTFFSILIKDKEMIFKSPKMHRKKGKNAELEFFGIEIGASEGQPVPFRKAGPATGKMALSICEEVEAAFIQEEQNREKVKKLIELTKTLEEYDKKKKKEE